MGSIVLFFSGWLDTTLLLAAFIWPVRLVRQALSRLLGR
jgi:hypothetical protein